MVFLLENMFPHISNFLIIFKIVVFKFWNWSVCNAVRKYFSMVLRVVVSGDTNRGAEGSATVDRHSGTLAIAAAPAHVP